MAQANISERQKDSDDDRIHHATPIAKVVELIGNSERSIEDAVERALEEASTTIKHITGVEVLRTHAVVRNNQIAQWRVDMRIAFGIDHHAHDQK